jgi:hypothetical protein
MKAEGKAEIYEHDIMSLLPLRRRIAAVAYVAWLQVEGLFLLVSHIASPLCNAGMLGVQTPMLYLVSSGIVFILLNSYLGRAWTRRGFQLITMVHQLSLISLSVWEFTCLKGTPHSWSGFRGAILCSCAMGNIETAILGVGDALTE